jgi:hypothetical protein
VPVPVPVPVAPVTRVRSRGRGRAWAAATAAVALASLALVGWTRSTTAQAPTPSRVVLIESSPATSDALSVFSSTTAPTYGVMEHRLALVAGTSVIGKLTRGFVCLELQTGSTVASACRTILSFRRRGLDLPLPTGSREVGGVRWSPDGRVRLVLPR